MLDVIASATRWVHFENYIIRSDAAGWRFAELLAARAREGVQVRVLYDWLGSVGYRARVLALSPASRRRSAGLSPASAGGRGHQRVPQSPEAGRGRRHPRRARRTVHRVRMDRGEPHRRPAVAGYRSGHRGPAAAVLDQTFASTWELAGRPVPPGPEGRGGGAARAARMCASSAASRAGSERTG